MLVHAIRHQRKNVADFNRLAFMIHLDVLCHTQDARHAFLTVDEDAMVLRDLFKLALAQAVDARIAHMEYMGRA